MDHTIKWGPMAQAEVEILTGAGTKLQAAEQHRLIFSLHDAGA